MREAMGWGAAQENYAHAHNNAQNKAQANDLI